MGKMTSDRKYLLQVTVDSSYCLRYVGSCDVLDDCSQQNARSRRPNSIRVAPPISQDWLWVKISSINMKWIDGDIDPTPFLHSSWIKKLQTAPNDLQNFWFGKFPRKVNIRSLYCQWETFVIYTFFQNSFFCFTMIWCLRCCDCASTDTNRLRKAIGEYFFYTLIAQPP